MASIENNYEINVAKKRFPDDQYGIHFCRIQLPEHFEKDAEEKLKFMRELFGDEFNISMTYWRCFGEHKDGWE